MGGLPNHMGNPSFEELMKVPLIVAPATELDSSVLLRGDDVHRIIGRLGNGSDGTPSELDPQELLLTEMGFLTYRRGPWKSFTRRRDGSLVLVNLERDPGETLDVSADHEQIVKEHRARVGALQSRLTGRSIEQALSEEEKDRLRSLGYLDE